MAMTVFYPYSFAETTSGEDQTDTTRADAGKFFDWLVETTQGQLQSLVLKLDAQSKKDQNLLAKL